MKIFHSMTHNFKRRAALSGVLACLALLVATKPMDDKKREMVVLTTPYGEMTVLLYDETPLHKANFIKLVESGFYNDLLFHRVINNFMIQGGDPESKAASADKQLGAGGPGYTIPSEISPDFIHKKGALAAARQGDQVNPMKESSGSQFYFVHGNAVDTTRLKSQNKGYSPGQLADYAALGGTPHLDGAYTVFGEVVEGMYVIDSIAAQATAKANRPLQDISMSMKIVKKRWQ
jgi:peptidyl-prolyl cis-trans isomerase B (cyclophilin B)